MLARAHHIETSRPGGRVRLLHNGTVLADSDDAVLLQEGKLRDRWYLPRADVRAELLDSPTTSHCPFKGDARYHSVALPDGEVLEDLVWYYPEPMAEVAAIDGRVCFYDERVELELDRGD